METHNGAISDPRTTREYLMKEWAALDSAWLPHQGAMRDIADYVLPFAASFELTDKDRDQRDRPTLILDNSATFASDVLRSGLLAGKTSPAKPWFKLETPDPSLNLFKPVKQWLFGVSSLMHRIFQSSNTYRALHSVYGSLGNFGVAPSLIVDDFEDVLRHFTLPIGEYRIACDERGQVNTLFREYTLTVEQCMQRFGNKMSHSVKNLYARGDYHTTVYLLHAIKPRRNSERQLGSKLAKDMAFMSCHMEMAGGAESDDKQILRTSGYTRFPALVPRWDQTRPTDAYGHGPGHRALGDIIQLQQEQMRKAQAIDYQANPPLAIPTGLKNREIDTLPGGSTYIDTASGEAGKITTLFNVNLDLNNLLIDIQDVRQRIDQAYYKNLFLMLANEPLSNSTATEILRREEEKVMMLGPVMNRLDNELSDPLIDITFDKMVTHGLVPPPPQELDGMELIVDYVSVLSQAQKATGILNLDRFVTSLGSVAAVKPNVLDKFNEDAYADAMADMLGIDPNLVFSGPEVIRIREEKAAAVQQQQQLESANMAADTAQKLSQANMNDDNALNRVIEGLGA